MLVLGAAKINPMDGNMMGDTRRLQFLNNQSESFGTVEPTPVEASLIYQDTKIEFNSSVSH